MRETPRGFEQRTGQAIPTTDVRIAGELLGAHARPLAADEVCPTLFRDVGPQALHAFLNGKLGKLEGPGSLCIFMRDASLPGFTDVVREMGMLTICNHSRSARGSAARAASMWRSLGACRRPLASFLL